MNPQESPFVNLLHRIHRLMERALRPFEPLLGALERLLQLFERVLSPIDRVKGIICALGWLATFVGYVLYYAFRHFGVSLLSISPSTPNWPIAASLMLSYSAIIFLVFLFLMYFCQGGRSVVWIWLLLSPIVGFALLWLSLEIRAQLFSQWLSQVQFDSWALGPPPSIEISPTIKDPSDLIYDYSYLCAVLARHSEIKPALEVWRFLSPFHLHVVSAAIIAAICIILTRMFFSSRVGPSHCLGITAFVVIAGSAMTWISGYDSDGPNEFGIYSDAQRILNPISRPFRAVVEMYADVSTVKATEVKFEFWKFGCSGSFARASAIAGDVSMSTSSGQCPLCIR